MKLLNSKNIVLSERIKGLITYNVDSQNTIVTTTLDGGVHVQTIGDHHPVVTFQCLVDYTGSENIGNAFVKGQVLKILDNRLVYSFIQVEAPTVERFSKKYENGLYIVSIRGKRQRVEVI